MNLKDAITMVLQAAPPHTELTSSGLGTSFNWDGGTRRLFIGSPPPEGAPDVYVSIHVGAGSHRRWPRLTPENLLAALEMLFGAQLGQILVLFDARSRPRPNTDGGTLETIDIHWIETRTRATHQLTLDGETNGQDGSGFKLRSADMVVVAGSTNAACETRLGSRQ